MKAKTCQSPKRFGKYWYVASTLNYFYFHILVYWIMASMVNEFLISLALIFDEIPDFLLILRG